jgi:hypothetical protein
MGDLDVGATAGGLDVVLDRADAWLTRRTRKRPTVEAFIFKE